MPDIDFQKIELNLIPKKGDEPVVFYASQYETARPFIAVLKWGDSEFAPGVDCYAEIDIRKNDDNLVVITDDVSIDNNEVSVVLPVQAVTCIGKNLGQVKIYAADDQLIAALNFILEVQADPLAGGVTSETAIDNLTQQIEDIAEEIIGEDYYNKTETDALLADKADKSEIPDMTNYYTKTQTDNLLYDKVDYDELNQYYKKIEVDNLLNAKVDKTTLQEDYYDADYISTNFARKTFVENYVDATATASGNPCTFDTAKYHTLIQALTAEIVCGGGGGTPSTPIPIVGHSELKLANVDNTTAQFWTADKSFDGTVDFNQLVYEPTIWTQNYKGFKAGTSFIQGHKILMSVGGTSSSTLFAYIYSNIGGVVNNSMNVAVGNTALFNCPFTQTQTVDEGHDTTDTVWIFVYSDDYAGWQNPSINVIDLTQMFGVSIADYIYSLEQSQAGAGVAFFKHFYPDDYYDYNVGETQTLIQMPYTVAFGQTVYGGVYDKSGRLTITWGSVDLGTLNWIYDSGLQRFQATVSGIKRASGVSELATGILCEALIANSDPVMFPTPMVDNTICRYTDNDNVYVLCSAYSDATTFKTAMNGIMLAYELATPIVIDVPSISVFAENGTNNIISDCGGDLNVSYKDTIQHYIDTRL